MDLQIPHHNKLQDDDQPIRKPYPRDIVLEFPGFDFDFQSDLNKLSSLPDNNESYVTLRLQKFILEQGMREDILRRCSSFLVSTVVFLALFYNIWSSVLPHQKQESHRFYLWSSLLGLFGFLVFVCTVAVMILVGAVLTPLQKAMLIVLLVLMHLQSANSILEVCVILLGGVFMAWYAFAKKESSNNESGIESSNMLANELSTQTMK